DGLLIRRSLVRAQQEEPPLKAKSKDLAFFFSAIYFPASPSLFLHLYFFHAINLITIMLSS
ncbi:hypothetical protein, partial [Vibrio vulnificus]|uniref:hypothetical protein n=1 Tax=Vibrio vulnificus TaxID=672 RepID=UPI001A94FA50